MIHPFVAYRMLLSLRIVLDRANKEKRKRYEGSALEAWHKAIDRCEQVGLSIAFRRQIYFTTAFSSSYERSS